MTRVELLAFMRRYRVAVQASVSVSGAPQAAIVGVADGDDFEIVFDTLQNSRKAQNLREHPTIALVLGGWGPAEEQTIQYEGVADEPTGAELERIRELYFSVTRTGENGWRSGQGSSTWECARLCCTTATSVRVRSG